MSCNGCRILRKKCSEWCSLKSCLQWIDSPQAQSNATLFLAKFFGRRDLMLFIESVPWYNRSALFQSLLFEACGRIINPVDGAVGLLYRGKWHVCQAAVNTVLAGGVLRPSSDIVAQTLDKSFGNMFQKPVKRCSNATAPVSMSMVSGESEMMTNDIHSDNEKRLLNLFV